MIRMYEILEDSNNDIIQNVGFENSNNLQIGIKSIDKISAFTSAKALKVLNIYTIITDAPIESNIFHIGEVCTLCYNDKMSSTNKDNIRNNYKFSIASIGESDGCIKLNVTTKDTLEKVKDCHIETNSDLISSQYVNQKYPTNIILTEVGKGSVKIKFKTVVSEYDGFIVAYRKADDKNVKWNFIKTEKEECLIENIEECVYQVRVMYFNSKEYSLFSPEVEMKFYI